MTIEEFFTLCNSHPWAYIALIINFGVIFINGWTDGPNSIATLITTRTMKAKPAIIMCALLNSIGVIAIGLLTVYLSKIMGGDISQTIAKLVDWKDTSIDKVLCAISMGLLAIVVVSLLCTYFGFPSSQSNCLIGGITGSGLSLLILGKNISIGLNPWIKVLIGFFGSLLLGFLLGYLLTLLIKFLFRKVTRGKSTRFFNAGQIVTSGLMSFFHGVQDGAKFMGIFILIGALLAASHGGDYLAILTSLNGTWWIFLPVAFIIGLGTLMGGYKIIKTLGSGMVNLEKYQAFATDIAASIGLLLATIFGLPVSTGTVKSTSIIGGGATRGLRRVKWPTAGKMVMWGVLSFPLSAFIALVLTMIFIWTCK